MVSIKDVRKSNLAFKLTQSPSGLVAVFAGATRGIGMGTLKQFAKHARAPKVYIIGRSKKSATNLLEELTLSNPDGIFEFIETEISLIKNVDLACEEIKSKEKKVDILFLSAGFLSWDGRNGMAVPISMRIQGWYAVDTPEGIDVAQSLRYYSRLRFVHDLLPLLTASPVPRVISILGGGKENAIDLNDLEVKKDFSLAKAAANGTTQTTLAFEELASSYPSVTFIHKYPGFVNTGVIDPLMASASGIYAIPATIFRWVLLPIVNLFSTSIDEAGERGLFLATSARYPPAKPNAKSVGVPLPHGLQVAQSSIVTDGAGNGVYRVGADDESAKESPVLQGYRIDKVGKKVWDETQAVWGRALESSGWFLRFHQLDGWIC